MITYTGEVLHTTAADEHDGVLLQVVALAGDVGVDLLAVGQTNTCTLRMAELGFFGVVVYTRVQTPRRWGHAASAGDFDLSSSDTRPFLTNC